MSRASQSAEQRRVAKDDHFARPARARRAGGTAYAPLPRSARPAGPGNARPARAPPDRRCVVARRRRPRRRPRSRRALVATERPISACRSGGVTSIRKPARHRRVPEHVAHDLLGPALGPLTDRQARRRTGPAPPRMDPVRPGRRAAPAPGIPGRRRIASRWSAGRGRACPGRSRGAPCAPGPRATMRLARLVDARMPMLCLASIGADEEVPGLGHRRRPRTGERPAPADRRRSEAAAPPASVAPPRAPPAATGRRGAPPRRRRPERFAIEDGPRDERLCPRHPTSTMCARPERERTRSRTMPAPVTTARGPLALRSARRSRRGGRCRRSRRARCRARRRDRTSIDRSRRSRPLGQVDADLRLALAEVLGDLPLRLGVAGDADGPFDRRCAGHR